MYKEGRKGSFPSSDNSENYFYTEIRNFTISIFFKLINKR